jgi:protein-S-isoprenylcysteine O-methyltransferase Ste14
MKYLRPIVFCLATILIYFGLPLLGRGPDNLGDYFSDHSRAGYALVALAFGLAVGGQSIDAPEGIRGGKGEESKLLRRQSVVRIVMILLLYSTLIFLPFADRRSIGVWSEDSTMRWFGLTLSGLGYALIFLSGLTLGKQYSQEVTIQENHQLITGDIFHYIRNPRYLGVIIMAVGLSCLFRSWIGLRVSMILIIVLLFRIRDEEDLLQREFGQQWHDYCKTSWRLIPYLY